MERYDVVKRLLKWYSGITGKNYVLYTSNKRDDKFPAYHHLTLLAYNVVTRDDKTVVCKTVGTYNDSDGFDKILDEFAVTFIKEVKNGIQ